MFDRVLNTLMIIIVSLLHTTFLNLKETAISVIIKFTRNIKSLVKEKSNVKSEIKRCNT